MFIMSLFVFGWSAYFAKNLGDVSDEHGERFHQQMKEIERRYHGFWDAAMLG